MSFGKRVKEWAKEHGYEGAVRNACDLVKQGKVAENELGFRSLAQGLMGDDWSTKLQMHQERGLESADAIDASAFTAISGNQLISKVNEGYNLAGMIGDDITTKIPITNQNLDTEKEPWLSDVRPETTDKLIVQPAMEFPSAEFTYNYFLKRSPEMRARKVEVTLQMIFADRTRQANDRAYSVGKMLRLDKEERILRVFLGLSGSTGATPSAANTFQNTRFTYAYAGGTETTSNTFIEDNTTGTLGKWENQLDSTPLVSFNDINSMEQLFARMTDPVTGKPIDIDATDMFVMPSKKYLAEVILNSTGVSNGSYAVTAGSGNNNTVTEASNPLGKPYKLYTSKHAYKLAALNELFTDQAFANGATITAAQAVDLWLLGDFKRALYYREAMPLTVRPVAAGNRDEVLRNIVLQIGAFEWGVAGVQDPHFIARAFGHAQNASTA